MKVVFGNSFGFVDVEFLLPKSEAMDFVDEVFVTKREGDKVDYSMLMAMY